MLVLDISHRIVLIHKSSAATQGKPNKREDKSLTGTGQKTDNREKCFVFKQGCR